MALQLSHESVHRVTGDYWRITNCYLVPKEEQVVLELGLFKDASASSAGKTPLETLSFDWGSTEYNSHFTPAVLGVVDQNPQERAYVLLKTLTTPVDFTLASDV